ncbi:MAG: 50S ribosomal protein L9 [Phycisphaerales bacterium]|jgi:large subunit ribosomal protein L9|nr:50S ribosomal protein L9 [Phycisphaerales bacterium]
MPKTVQLLLTDTVDNLGIVGDVVTVRTGYARNYLLPRGLATSPSQERITELATARKEAEKHLAELRSQREAIIKRMDKLEITLQRSCNEMGILYGAVTQQDLASALTQVGFPVKAREVRLSQTIKRVDNYDILVKFASDLEAHVRVHVTPDRTIVADEREEMDFDNEGNLIDKNAPRRGRRDEGVDAIAGDEKPSRKRRERSEA